MTNQARPGYSLCATCGAEVLWTVDSAGVRHALDLHPPTYIIVGHEKEGTPKVVQSSGYVVHVATCSPKQS